MSQPLSRSLHGLPSSLQAMSCCGAPLGQAGEEEEKQQQQQQQQQEEQRGCLAREA